MESVASLNHLVWSSSKWNINAIKWSVEALGEKNRRNTADTPRGTYVQPSVHTKY